MIAHIRTHWLRYANEYRNTRSFYKANNKSNSSWVKTQARRQARRNNNIIVQDEYVTYCQERRAYA